MSKLPLGAQLEYWASAASHLAGDAGAAASLAQIRNMGAEVITPYDYGADPEEDWTVDRQAEVQACLDEARGSWDTPMGAFRLIPSGGFRRWNVGSGVYVNNLGQQGFTMLGWELFGSGAGSTVLDLAGVNSPNLDFVRIGTDLSDPPACGLLTSRTEDTGNGQRGFGRWISLDIDGHFTATAGCAIATEVSAIIGGAYINRSMVETARAHVNVSNYQAVLDSCGAISSGATLPNAGTLLSNLTHDHVGVRFLRSAYLNATISAISGNPATVTVNTNGAVNIALAALVPGQRVYFPVLVGTGLDSLRHTERTIASVDVGAGTITLTDFNASSVTFTSGRVVNVTGPALTLCGTYSFRATQTYILSHGLVAPIDIDGINDQLPTQVQIQGPVELNTGSVVQIRTNSTARTWTDPRFDLANQNQVNTHSTIRNLGPGVISVRGGRFSIAHQSSTPPANGMFYPADQWGFYGGTVIETPQAAALPDPDALANDDCVLIAYDRSPPTEDRRHVSMGGGLLFDGHPPGTLKNFAYATAGPHALGSNLPDSVTVQVDAPAIVEIQLPNDLRPGASGICAHLGVSGYSYLTLPSGGSFAGGQRRTVGQHGVVGWQCIANPGSAPVVKMFGGELLA